MHREVIQSLLLGKQSLPVQRTGERGRENEREDRESKSIGIQNSQVKREVEER